MLEVEKALHTLWQSRSNLTELLPAANVFTGRAPNPEQALPYATLQRVGDESTRLTTRNRYRTTTIRVTIRSATFEEGRAIAEQLAAPEPEGFDLEEFTLDTGEVIDLRVGSQASLQTEEGAWEAEVELICRTCEPRS